MAQSFSDNLNDKVIPPILKFVNTKPITALKNGMMLVMPLTIVGAVFLLLANFPVKSVVAWETRIGLAPILNQVYVSTFNLLGLVEDEVLMALPLVPSHDECPTGVVHSVQTDDFDEAAEEKPHPFAALAALKNKKP